MVDFEIIGFKTILQSVYSLLYLSAEILSGALMMYCLFFRESNQDLQVWKMLMYVPLTLFKFAFERGLKEMCQNNT